MLLPLIQVLCFVSLAQAQDFVPDEADIEIYHCDEAPEIPVNETGLILVTGVVGTENVFAIDCEWNLNTGDELRIFELIFKLFDLLFDNNCLLVSIQYFQ